VDNPSCQDDDADCADWARQGECTRNADFMLRTCRLSCQACKVQIEVRSRVILYMCTSVSRTRTAAESSDARQSEQPWEAPCRRGATMAVTWTSRTRMAGCASLMCTCGHQECARSSGCNLDSTSMRRLQALCLLRMLPVACQSCPACRYQYGCSGTRRQRRARSSRSSRAATSTQAAASTGTRQCHRCARCICSKSDTAAAAASTFGAQNRKHAIMGPWVCCNTV
jgi:ShK domain-like